MMVGRSERVKYRSFLDVEEGGMKEVKSERRKQSHTVSDSAAERKAMETESLHASTGVVYDSIFAMHPSGKSCNSLDVSYDAEPKLASTLY